MFFDILRACIAINLMGFILNTVLQQRESLRLENGLKLYCEDSIKKRVNLIRSELSKLYNEIESEVLKNATNDSRSIY